MNRKNVTVFLVFLGTLLFVVKDVYPQSMQEIMVSAAISLKSPFEDIGRTFEGKHRGVKIYFNFGASGDLKRQIEGGAPVNVFASASLQDMDELEKVGRIIHSTRFNFARNELVLVEPLDAEFKLKSFNDLTREMVKKIAIGNPKTVPAGRYAKETLERLTLFDAIKDKLVYGEHARQVLNYVARGEVDAGIVYVTDARLRSREVKVIMEAPEGSHPPAVYPIAVVKRAENESLSKEFAAFVSSREAKQIFKRYGFLPFVE